jgi:hypothetical protein
MMPLLRVGGTAVLGALLLLLGSAVAGPPGAAAPPDSTGAQIDVERDGERLHIRGVFANDTTRAGPLAYALAVRRTGPSGTSQTSQSGTFETAPGQTDTLSTVTVNASPGATLRLHLVIRRGETTIDTARVERTVEPR